MTGTAAKTAGWGMVAAFGCACVLAILIAATDGCLVGCERAFPAWILLATGSCSGLAAAVWLFLRGYEPGTVSTPAVVAAKAGRILARAPFLFAIASFLLVWFTGPAETILVVVWNVGAAVALSEGSRRLDCHVRSDVLSQDVGRVVAVAAAVLAIVFLYWTTFAG